MKKLLFFALLLLISGGCASTDRMVRMSGGVFDEYAAPKSSRIRSQKYQKVTRELASPSRSNQGAVAALDDTLVNIWPFFFRNNDYWSILWPLVDKDPYGFALRPFYNHEGDDYSILFPLSSWNVNSKHGWVTLFAWTPNAFGFIPLTWQWKNEHSGGAYYTPLFIYNYDDQQIFYNDINQNKWTQEKFDIFCFLFCYSTTHFASKGDWDWLYHYYITDGDIASLKNEWNYRFKGKKPFPENKTALEKYRQEIFTSLPRMTDKKYGFFPIWMGCFRNDDSYYWQRFLGISGMEKSKNHFEFDIAGDIIGSYSRYRWPDSRHTVEEEKFESVALLSGFKTVVKIKQDELWQKFNRLSETVSYREPFSKQKPAVEDALKAFDPSVSLPETVTDVNTFNLFLDDLWKKYKFNTCKQYEGMILPLVWYGIDEADGSYNCVIPALLTGWGKNPDGSSYFNSLPLLTNIRRSKTEEKSIVLTPLVYYSKTFHRERSNYQVFDRSKLLVDEYQCVELRDQYAACGLFYRGKFGFNIVKEGFNAKTVETVRSMLATLHITRDDLAERNERIKQQTSINDRWQTTTEIERLKKLIRYEELKISRAELARDRQKYMDNVAKTLAFAEELNFPLDIQTFADKEKSDAARTELMEKYTEVRYYEDIGNGMIFHKAKYYNGDNRWHFMHILAGGEKSGDKESTHILHLLYRSRKEGQRSEKIIFPFISSVTDGEDSRISFLWRVFSLSKRNGKRGGHILFIPFGAEWE